MQQAKVLGPHREQFSGTLVKLVILAVTASKKPIHDAKEKTPGNKGSKGEKAKIKAMERTRVALAGFLDVNLFPETSTTSTSTVPV